MGSPRPVASATSKPSGTPTPSSTTRTARPSARRSNSIRTVPEAEVSTSSGGKAWSTAFWSNSVRTTARVMATWPGTTPASSWTVNDRGRNGEETLSSTTRTRGRTISPNATSSSALWARVSCTTEMDPMRRTDSPKAARASSDCSRRAWSLSSDEMVCKLFFTRWWISRMVVSLDTNWRSRRRSSVTSRTRTMAPVATPVSSSGKQWLTTATSSDRSISSMAAVRRENADRSIAEPNPVSPNRAPTTPRVIPSRWRTETALGDANSIRPSASTNRRPSPTRGVRWRRRSTSRYGNSPASIMDANRSKTVR